MYRRFSGKQNVYLEIAEQYKEYIRLGLLQPGEKLPSVRNAATDLGVNPNTIARAYTLLEEEGFVTSLPKKGIYVLGEIQESEETEDLKKLLYSIKNKGICKEKLLKLVEEVYDSHD